MVELENAGVVVTDRGADAGGDGTASDTVRRLLDDDSDRAAVIGADLSRLPDERFAALFGDPLQRLRAAAERLPAGDRVYVLGVRTDDALLGTAVDVGSGEAPGFLTGAELAFAYAPRESEGEGEGGDGGAEFAHLTGSLADVDYLLPAMEAGGRLDGPATTMDALRRELVARHARRLTLLDTDRERYDEEFRFVLAAPLSAYDRVVGERENGSGDGRAAGGE